MAGYHPAKWTSLWKNILLVLLSLVLCFGTVEVLLRLYNPLGFRIKGDKVVLPVNKTEIKPHHNSIKLDRDLTIHRNSLGFRGAEPPTDFAQWLTIVTVGGSTTECRELADDRTWPEVLAAKLQLDFQKIWINNAGLSGHSTYGHLVLVQDYIVKLQPKIVIFLVGVNDMGSKVINNADKSIKKGLTLSSFRSLERFLGAMSGCSEVAAVMLNLKRYFFPKIETQIAYDEIDYRKLPVFMMSDKQRSDLEERYQKEYLGPYLERLEQLIDVVKLNNMIPVMVTQPAAYGDVMDDVTGVNLGTIRATKNMNGSIAWEVLERYNEITRKTCKRKGIFLIDLAREMPKSSKYYYDLIHYTNEGAQKVAEIIFANLAPWLAKNYQDHLNPGTKISFR